MLYPPYIDGVIPAFYGDSLTVPFSMNPGVGAGEVQGFSLKIKSIQNTKYLFTTTDVIEYDISGEYYVKFDISSYANKLKEGQHYKVQIAYIGQDGVGYYSTVGIIKYTKKPKVTIKDLKGGRINASKYSYIGSYYSEDETEKEYQYCFIFFNEAGKVLKETGWQLHNSSNDNLTYQSYDEFTVPFDLERDQTYYIQYKVITNNKLCASSVKYRVHQQQSIDPDIKIKLIADMYKDNGYVLLTMEGEYDDYDEEKSMTGAFLISRSSEDSDFKTWEEILRFRANGVYPSRWSYKDFTVEQGKTYIYSFQQYNDFSLYSARVLSNTIFSDFEDIFLYDGKRQLKISYNPQVQSFKTDVLESKTETLGHKYPFVLRNGLVEYKEFSLNGLISYLSDEEHLFMTNKEMGLVDSNLARKATILPGFEPDDQYYFDKQYSGIDIYQLKENYKVAKENYETLGTAHLRTTDLVDYNMSAERIFKLEVLDWLNNGEPKLFRSASEGNYIVRLMNISLSPEDTLGRMLHNFSCTAYEIDECNYSTLNNYGIVKVSSPEEKVLHFKTKLLKELKDNGKIIDSDYAVTIKFEDMMPGDIIKIRTENDDQAQIIVIGATGTYQINTGTKIINAEVETNTLARIKKNGLSEPQVTYSYYEASINSFNEIAAINFNDIPAKQYIGNQSNIVEQINNIKDTLTSFFYLHFYKRDIEDIEIKVKFNEELKKNTYDYSSVEMNSFYLYRFTIDETVDKVKYYTPITLTEKDFNYYGNKLPNDYYIKEKDEYIKFNQWKEDTQYYIQSFFTFLVDLNNFDKLIVSQEEYEYLSDYYSKDQLEELYEIYSTEIGIDFNVIDLNDIKEYSIKGPILFKNIELTNGVLLECGYNVRSVTFDIENTDKLLKEQQEKITSIYAKIKNYDNLAELDLLNLKKQYNDEKNKYYVLLNNLREEFS